MFRALVVLPMILAYLTIIGWFMLLSLKGILQYTLKAMIVSSLVQLFFIQAYKLLPLVLYTQR